MNKNFNFSNGVELDLGVVESISPMYGDPNGNAFYVWITFKNHSEPYRYLLGANAKQARQQYTDLVNRLSLR